MVKKKKKKKKKTGKRYKGWKIVLLVFLKKGVL